MKNALPTKGAFLSNALETILTIRLKAGAAVDRTVSAGLERHLSGLAATIADHVKHLTLATVGTAVGSATRGAAGGAAAGLILEALVSIELLLRSGEHEFVATIAAYQGLVFEHGKYPPNLCAHTMFKSLMPSPVIGRVPPEGYGSEVL